jgi:hypothetical protein
MTATERRASCGLAGFYSRWQKAGLASGIAHLVSQSASN